MALTGEKELIAPCGLYCGTCAFYRESEIIETAIRLKKLLKGFEGIAELYKEVAPELKDYPKFVNVLDYLVKQDCRSCRGGGGTVKGAACMPKTCPIRVCLSKRRVDFCYQCGEFPCEKIPAAFKKVGDETLAEIWFNCNKKMKNMGLDRYLQKKKKEPRYKKLGG